MKSLGIIPARYDSTRFPGKPLALINGKTMIEWVYKRALKSNLDKVIIATDDHRIFQEVTKFGGEAALTSRCHKTGTDRIAEVAVKKEDFDLIVNIQGDEPLIEPEVINKLLKAFEDDNEIIMSTLKHKIDSDEDIDNPNVVKVITDKNDRAIYFSRSCIPYKRNNTEIEYYRHIGIYAYTRDFLLKYCKMEQTILEKTESLEQLRAIENGYKIKVLETKKKIYGVDTKEDLEKVIDIINKNNIEI